MACGLLHDNLFPINLVFRSLGALNTLQTSFSCICESKDGVECITIQVVLKYNLLLCNYFISNKCLTCSFPVGNLLFADTILLVTSQLLYILAVAGLFVIRYICVVIVLVAIFTSAVSPLNLSVMSLERYVCLYFFPYLVLQAKEVSNLKG